MAITHRFHLCLLTRILMAVGFLAPTFETKAANAFFNAGLLIEGRNYHSATLLANGKVLIAGGNRAGSNTPVASAEIYDPATGISSTTGSLAVARAWHRSLLLPNGRVFVIGGISLGGLTTTTAELYNPTTGTWTDVSPSEDAFFPGSCTLLKTGKVLVVGGTDSATQTAKAKLYDPGLNSWTPASSLASVHGSNSAVLLPDGRVLVAGGYHSTSNAALDVSDVYDPAEGSWSSSGKLTEARNVPNLQRLANGKVLAIGGNSGTTITAEQFDPATRSWTATGSLTQEKREGFAAVSLGDGSVLVTGGFQATSPLTTMLSSVESYDPASGTWTRVDSLNTPRCLHQATLLGDGKILMTGGWGYNHPAVYGDFNHGIRQVETYQAVAGNWTMIAPLNNYRREHTTTTLANGNVLVAGGYGHIPDSPDPGHTTGPIAKAEILNLSTGVWSETAAMASPRYGHTAIALKNGNILAFGAYGGDAEVYAPDTGSWSSAGMMTSGGVSVGKPVGTLLKNGRVIVTGSSDGRAQLYDPVANAWSTTSQGGPQGAHTATLLPTGKVLTLEGYYSPKCSVYDPQSNIWTSTGSPLEPRYSHSACLLPSGKVLICGGLGFRNSQPNFPLTSAELYDPATGKWTAASPTGKSRYFPSLVRIGENRILATGGEKSETSNTAEIYDETSNSWTPTSPLLEARSHFSVTPWDGGILATGGMGGFFLPSVEVFDPPFPGIAVEQPAGTSISSSANKNFGTVGVGSTKAIQFNIRNNGTSSLTGLTVTRSGANAGEFGVALQGSGGLAPDAGAILMVTFKPTAVGAKSAMLTLVCNDGREHPFVIGLTGKAISPRPEISVQQPVKTELRDGKSKIGFGTVKVGKSGSAKTFIIKNTGTGKLSGLSLKTDGNHPKDFISGELEKTSLAPGASTSFKVTFKPTKKGIREAWVHVRSNDANEGSFDIKFTGFGAAR